MNIFTKGLAYFLFFIFLVDAKAQNNALHFNGISPKGEAHISVPHHHLLNLTQATFEVWVYWQGTENLSNLFMKIGNPEIAGYGWGVGINRQGYLEWWQQFLQGEGPQTTQNPVPLYTWTHIAVTVVHHGEIKFYVNGVLAGTKTAKIMNANGNLIIGKQGEHGNYFRGIMDDFRIWNVVRSPEQIKDNMHKELTGSESNLLLYYNFNHDDANNLVHDIAQKLGGANDGVLKIKENTILEKGLEASFKQRFKGLRFKERIGDEGELVQFHLDLGLAHYADGQIKESMKAYFKALETNQALPTPSKKNEMYAYYYLSNAYGHLKQYDEAISYAEKALTLAKQFDETIVIVDAQNTLGLVATKQKQYQKGRDYYEKSSELASQTQDWGTFAHTLQYLAESYLEEKMYDKAIGYLHKSLEVAQKHTLLIEEKNACRVLASLYGRQGRYEDAYKYEQKHNTLKDTLSYLQKKQQIAELIIEFETEKKTQQIQLLEKDQILKTYILYTLGTVLVLFIILALYRHKIQKRIHKEKQKAIVAKLALQELESEAKLAMQEAQNEAKLAMQEMQSKIEQERYEEQIAYQERELTSNAMHLFQKNEMLNTLQEKLNELNPDIKAQVKPLLQEVRNTIDLDKDWENFQRHFIEVHPKFFEKLLEAFPTLSQTDLKLLAYIRMKLSNKEVASLMNVATKSVEMSRYRIKKKFNLGAEDSLDRWVENF